MGNTGGRRAKRNAFAFVLLALLVVGCSRESPPEAGPAKWSGTLSIAGSSTMLPLVSRLAREFEQLNPGVRIEVRAGGSDAGIRAARDGKADIGMVSHALTEAERDLHGLVIARDGVALIVHRDNPVAELSRSQIVDIFTGKLADWRAAGGAPGPIVVINRDANRSAPEQFCRHFGLRYDAIVAHRTIGDSPEAIDAVHREPGAIAYVSIGDAGHAQRAGKAIRLLALEGVPASAQTLRSGDYPIARGLTLVTAGPPGGLTKAFIDFALAPRSTQAIRESGFVPYLD